MDDVLNKVKRRNRQRSIAISDHLIDKIKQITQGAISVSGFIRMAILNELEKHKKNGERRV